jgi:O-antigen/teichoic acid export membrane protein
LSYPESSAGRGVERVRRVILSVLAAAPARTLQVVVLIVSTPLTLNYLGPQRFGLWVAISSLVTFVQSADFGIGNALINATATAYGKDDRLAACRYVSNGLAVVTGMALLLGGLFAVAYPSISWAAVFNLSRSQTAQEAGLAVAIALGLSLMRLPCGLVEKIRLGYQEAYINSIWDLGSSILGLALLMLLIFVRAPLYVLVLALAGGPVLGGLGNWSFLLLRQRPWLRPRRGLLSFSCTRDLFGVGLMFFGMYLAGVVTYSLDGFIAIRVLGADATTIYALASKLFSFCNILTGLFLFPFWSAYGEAIARSDIRWVRKSLSNSLFGISGVNTVVATFIIVFHHVMLRVWTGRDFEVPLALILGLALQAVLQSFGTAISFFLNGAGIIRFQLVISITCAVLSLPAKVLLARTFGVSGIIWGTILVYLVTTLVPYAIFVPQYIRRVAAQAAIPVATGQ